jgi:hypothetical protein
MLPIILASVSVLLNIIQFFVGLGKDRRIKRYQDLDYAVRLRLVDEELTLSEGGSGQSLSYSAKIENCSSKLVIVKAIKVLWEGVTAPAWGQMNLIELQSYLKPGEKKEVRINYAAEQFEEMKKRLQVWESKFNLQVFYVDASGETIEKKIPLARFTPNGGMTTGRFGNIVA